METEQMAEVYGAPGTRPSDHSKAARKQAKADERRAKHERAMRGAVTTPAQRIMRKEMEAGVHKLGDVMDGILGPLSQGSDLKGQQVSEVAHMLIEENGAELRLGLKEWPIIQRIVEAAVRVNPADL